MIIHNFRESVGARSKLGLGACSTCRTRKLRCGVSPGASICQRCEQSGLASTCVLEASRTRPIRSSSMPPADPGLPPIPTGCGRKRSNLTQSWTSSTSGHQPTKKIRSTIPQSSTQLSFKHGPTLGPTLGPIYEDDGESMVRL